MTGFLLCFYGWLFKKYSKCQQHHAVFVILWPVSLSINALEFHPCCHKWHENGVRTHDEWLAHTHTHSIYTHTYMVFKYFFHSLGCLLILLMVSFAMQKLFSSSSFSVYFAFCWLCFLYQIQKIDSQNLYQGVYSLCFSWGFLWFYFI